MRNDLQEIMKSFNENITEEEYHQILSKVEDIAKASADHFQDLIDQKVDELIDAKNAYLQDLADANTVLESLDIIADVLQAKYPVRCNSDPLYWRQFAKRYDKAKAKLLFAPEMNEPNYFFYENIWKMLID